MTRRSPSSYPPDRSHATAAETAVSPADRTRPATGPPGRRRRGRRSSNRTCGSTAPRGSLEFRPRTRAAGRRRRRWTVPRRAGPVEVLASPSGSRPGFGEDLEHLLEETADAGVTRFVWLRQFEPGSNSAAAQPAAGPPRARPAPRCSGRPLPRDPSAPDHAVAPAGRALLRRRATKRSSGTKRLRSARVVPRRRRLAGAERRTCGNRGSTGAPIGGGGSAPVDARPGTPPDGKTGTRERTRRTSSRTSPCRGDEIGAEGLRRDRRQGPAGQSAQGGRDRRGPGAGRRRGTQLGAVAQAPDPAAGQALPQPERRRATRAPPPPHRRARETHHPRARDRNAPHQGRRPRGPRHPFVHHPSTARRRRSWNEEASSPGQRSFKIHVSGRLPKPELKVRPSRRSSTTWRKRARRNGA